MNVLDPWNVFFLVGLIVFLFTRHVFEQRSRGQRTTDSRIDGIEKLLMVGVFGSMFLPLLYLFSPWLDFATHPRPAPMAAAGAVVLTAALWLFWRSHADLGSNWSVSLEVREEHRLITGGVYERVRHPMYASIWLWSIGQALLIPNWIAGCAMFVAFGAMYVIRTPREEQLMLDAFGDEYRDYMNRTGRVLPKLRRAVIEEPTS